MINPTDDKRIDNPRPKPTADTTVSLFDQILDNSEKLAVVRNLNHLINKTNYLKLQEEQWTYFFDFDTKEDIYTGRIEKNGLWPIQCTMRMVDQKYYLNNVKRNIDKNMN